jgi:hypothetical protein
MKRLRIAKRLLLACCVAITCAWAGNANAQNSTPALPKGLESVVRQFAGSYILGTGESHFITTIRAIDTDNAVAVVGSTSDDGRNPEAYTVYAKRIGGKWKITRYEFVFKPTGKRTSKDQIPPFPYPNWQKNAP